MDWRVATLGPWPTQLTEERRSHPFRKSVDHGNYVSLEHGIDWTATMALLDSELFRLTAENIVLQMDVEQRHIRRDGWIKQNTMPRTPAIILSFDSKYGPLLYPCDTFTSWQGNLRAIAKGLQDLRRLDRYGITQRGEQYTGWLQIPSKTGDGEYKRPESILSGLTGYSEQGVLDAPKLAYRAAAKIHHPDFGGDEETMKRITEAARSLGVL